VGERLGNIGPGHVRWKIFFFFFFFFFLSSTTLYKFWLGQLFLSIVSSLAPSVFSSSLPFFSGHFSRRKVENRLTN
jgi:hypothetical protein